MLEKKPQWTEDAIEKINKAPFFIRGLAKKKTEKAAIDQGQNLITVEFIEQVRNGNSKS